MIAKALQACIDAIDPREGDAERAAWELAIDALEAIGGNDEAFRSALSYMHHGAVQDFDDHLYNAEKERGEDEEIDEAQAELDAENQGHLNLIGRLIAALYKETPKP